MGLTLTRREGQQVRLRVREGPAKGLTIWLMVHDVGGGKARVTITAPPEVDIQREEIIEQNPQHLENP